jgi:hypothetical protein
MGARLFIKEKIDLYLVHILGWMKRTDRVKVLGLVAFRSNLLPDQVVH